MIIYSIWLYEVDARHLPDFVAAFREGGKLYDSLRRIPGHIHTDLLNGSEIVPGSCRLLSISFFTSFEASLRGEQSVQMRALVHWLRERTTQCIRLGSFSHFPSSEPEILFTKALDQRRTKITPTELRG